MMTINVLKNNKTRSKFRAKSKMQGKCFFKLYDRLLAWNKKANAKEPMCLLPTCCMTHVDIDPDNDSKLNIHVQSSEDKYTLQCLCPSIQSRTHWGRALLHVMSTGRAYNKRIITLVAKTNRKNLVYKCKGKFWQSPRTIMDTYQRRTSTIIAQNSARVDRRGSTLALFRSPTGSLIGSPSQSRTRPTSTRSRGRHVGMDSKVSLAENQDNNDACPATSKPIAEFGRDVCSSSLQMHCLLTNHMLALNERQRNMAGMVVNQKDRPPSTHWNNQTLYAMCLQMRQDIVGTKYVGLRRHDHACEGKAVELWMVINGYAKNTKEAVVLGETLLERAFLKGIGNHKRFQVDDTLYKMADSICKRTDT